MPTRPAEPANPSAPTAENAPSALERMETMLQTLTTQVQTLNESHEVLRAKLNNIERQEAQNSQRSRSDAYVPDTDIINPSLWNVSALTSEFARRELVQRILEYYTKECVTRYGEKTRDYYEAEAITKLLQEMLRNAVREAAPDTTLSAVRTAEFNKMIERLTLLREKSLGGVNAMRFVQKRLEERQVIDSLREPIKELRQRQQQAELFRAGLGRSGTKDEIPPE